MERDIHKLGVWLEKVCQQGIAVERKVFEWKLAESKKQDATSQVRAS